MTVNDLQAQADFYVWLAWDDGTWLADVLRDGYTDPEGRAPPPGHDMGWRSAQFDLSPYKGQSVKLVWENRNLDDSRSLGIWTLVDDVRVVDAGSAR
jgi:hypothetical protein